VAESRTQVTSHGPPSVIPVSLGGSRVDEGRATGHSCPALERLTATSIQETNLLDVCNILECMLYEVNTINLPVDSQSQLVTRFNQTTLPTEADLMLGQRDTKVLQR
jgi:hypothetical protein